MYDEQTIRRNDRSHVFHSWSAQGLIDPLPIAGAAGSYFWDYSGKRYLDFSSQLVNVNIGYQHPSVVAAIKEQVDRMATLIEHARDLGSDVIGPLLAGLSERHPSVGDVRGLGVFWAIELVRDRETREPLVPFNASGAAAAPMAEFAAACKAAGLWPFTHFNRTHVVPPCTTTAEEVKEGIAILDEALTVADRYYTGTR